MLWARVTSDGVRALCPEIVAGVYTPEEIADFEPERPTQSKQVRRAELAAMAEESKPKTDDVVGAAGGTVPHQTDSTAAPPPPATSSPADQQPAPEPADAANSALATDFTPGSQSPFAPASSEQLGQLATLAGELGRDLSAVAEMCVKNYGCKSDLSNLSRAKVRELIENFKKAVAEKKSSATSAAT